MVAGVSEGGARGDPPPSRGTERARPLPRRSIPVVQTLRTTALTMACADRSDQRVAYLEHVVARISISHPRRGDLQIHLISPSGTKSQLLAKR